MTLDHWLWFSFGYACCAVANWRVSKQREAALSHIKDICDAMLADIRERKAGR